VCRYCGIAVWRMWRMVRCGHLRVLRNGLKRILLVLRRSVALAFGLHPFDFSSRPRASRSYGQVLRSIDI
jgi:hypothetical protein